MASFIKDVLSEVEIEQEGVHRGGITARRTLGQTNRTISLDGCVEDVNALS